MARDNKKNEVAADNATQPPGHAAIYGALEQCIALNILVTAIEVTWKIGPYLVDGKQYISCVPSITVYSTSIQE